MLDFYEQDAVLVDAQGVPQRGREQIRKELLKYYSVQLPMHIIARHIFVAGDTASLVLDWNIASKAPDGTAVHMVATSNDIARKGPDGFWRYIIDNPFRDQAWGRDLAIIAFTGRDLLSEETEFRLAGFDKHLFKPTNKEELFDAVVSVFQDKQFQIRLDRPTR